MPRHWTERLIIDEIRTWVGQSEARAAKRILEWAHSRHFRTRPGCGDINGTIGIVWNEVCEFVTIVTTGNVMLQFPWIRKHLLHGKKHGVKELLLRFNEIKGVDLTDATTFRFIRLADLTDSTSLAQFLATLDSMVGGPRRKTPARLTTPPLSQSETLVARKLPSLTPARSRSQLTIFSWGFWGWGTATHQLVSAMDAAERQRGFNPPVFVDVRFKRSGRAPGFKEAAFEDLLGWRRYRWMPTLGNSSIGTRMEGRIACPAAVSHLLDIALEARDRCSRVVFFCACPSPELVNCHRSEVARLLRREARRRRVEIDVQEWPGQRPAMRELPLHVSTEALRAVARGAKSVVLGRRLVPRQLVGLPWGTIVVLRAGSETLPVAVGPAAYRSGEWVLPRFQDDESEPALDGTALRRQTMRLRRKCGLD